MIIKPAEKEYKKYYKGLFYLISNYYDSVVLNLKVEQFSSAFISRWAGDVNNKINKGCYKAKINIVPSPNEQELIALRIQENVNLITKISSDIKINISQDIQNFIIKDEVYDLNNIIKDNINASKTRLKLIARDQAHKAYETIKQARCIANGIDTYMWRGMMDSRERDTHKAQEGKIFRYDEEPKITGHPSDQINCRCISIPQFKD